MIKKTTSRIRGLTTAFAFFATAFSAAAETQVVPYEGWEDDYDPIASPDAVVGGKIRIGASQYPSSFNYYLDQNAFSAALFSQMYETMLTTDPITAQMVPHLAESVTMSDDKRVFTFTLDERAKWSDGKPVTAEDVAFTVDTITDPKNLTGPHKIDFERFELAEVIDERTIRFTAKEVHWKNLIALGNFAILPKHYFEGRDFNKENFEFPVVSGPYRLGEVREGVYVRVERRDDWWIKDAKRVQGVGNFQTMEFRFYAQRDMAFEAFKNEEFDLHAIYTSHIWVQETDSEAFQKNWIVKQAVTNYDPPAWQGFAMNMRRDKFKDKRVRQALAHLLDRERFNREIMFNQYKLHRAYWEDLYETDEENPNEPITFDVDKARALLAEAGWKVNPDTGKLEKDGKPFVINFLTRTPTSDKFLVIYREALADVGIDLNIDRKDWAAWTKEMDEFNYEMTWAAWGSSLFKDPESQWHSKEVDRNSSVNITGFQDPKVDALIESQKGVFDIQERNRIVREIDEILYAETPYILLWYNNYTRLLYWNKFGTPDTVLSKFGDERSAWSYWWYDEDSAADLEAAKESGESLPEREYDIQFDEHFID